MKISRILYSRLLQHLVFWLSLYWVVLKLVSDSTTAKSADAIYAGFSMLPLFLVGYVNLQLLLPKCFNRKKYWKYASTFGMLVLVASCFGLIFFEVCLDSLMGDYYFVPVFTFLDWIALTLSVGVVTSLLYFTSSWFYTAREREMMVRLRQQQSEAELQLLKSQLNPHFLFNTLNSIYALVLKKSDKAAEALVRLSDIFRYMVYETSAQEISLERELEVLRSYIDLQRLRLAKDVEVTYTEEGDAEGLQVAPLLLFPFVENAFKHGTRHVSPRPFVNVTVSVDGARLRLKVGNNKPTTKSSSSSLPCGVGLENVRRQLDLLYPGAHRLEVEDEEEVYNITLDIRLKEAL